MYREDLTNLTATEYQNNFIFKTFMWMVAGLLTTAVCAIFAYSTGLIWQLLYGNTFTVLLIGEIAAVLVFSFLFSKLPPAVVTVLFFGYAILNGLTLSVIFAIYQMSSIILLFMAGALLFGGFAAYGYRCKSDLTRWGPLLLITLIVVLIMSLINLFILKNSFMETFIDCAVLFLFFGITSYDMNRLKQYSMMALENDRKLYIYGAMQLYLDFINIFLRLLALFGKRK